MFVLLKFFVLIKIFKDGFREMTSERHLIEAVVPFFLDRCTDHVKILDAYSMHYISLIVIAYLEKELLVQKEVIFFKTFILKFIYFF